ncbi:MAG: hypothetical protein WCG36_08625 [bacterium]
MNKHDRVLATLNHQPVDRCAVLEQLSYNPRVDLMERGTPAQVRAEVHRHIRDTRALETGGMFVASSSEINPPIPSENFRAMVEAVWEERAVS